MTANNSITTIDELEKLYNTPVSEIALWKEINHINDHYKHFIGQSPFLILATQGPAGLDCSPRGDPAGFVRVVDEKHIQIPDRRGNNRLDSLRNIVHNSSVGIIFLIPNVGETIRLSGEASIIIDPELCESFSVNGKPASSVLSIEVNKVYFQCQKAIARSQLWDPSTYIKRDQLPSPGDMAKIFAAAHGSDFDGKQYDKNYPERLKKTIY